MMTSKDDEDGAEAEEMNTPKRPAPENISNIPGAPAKKIDEKDKEISRLKNENVRLRQQVKKANEEMEIMKAMYSSKGDGSAPLLPPNILQQQLNDARGEIGRLKVEIERNSQWFQETLGKRDEELAKLHNELAEQRANLKKAENELENKEKETVQKNKDIFELRQRQEVNRQDTATLKRQLEAALREKKFERQKNPFSSLLNYTSRQKRFKAALISLIQIAEEEDFSELLNLIYKQAGEDDDLTIRTKMTPSEAMFIMNRVKMTKKGVEAMKSFLRHLGIADPFPSRADMDELEKEMMESAFIKVFTDPDGTVVGKVEDIKAFIEIRLKELAAEHKLIFDKVTGEDIHIAFFADKGGPTTKLVAVIINLKNPNSRYHIIPLGMFNGDDNADNMKKYLGDVLEQINNLESVEYEEDGKMVKRRVEHMLGGDLKFLSSCYGHFGGNCHDLCILCYANNEKNHNLAHIDLLKGEARTFDEYVKDAKNGTNSIYPDTEILFKRVKFENIIPPSLHIIMGLAHRYFFEYFLNLAASMDNPTSQPVTKLSLKKSHLNRISRNLSQQKAEIEEIKKEKGKMGKILETIDHFIAKKVDKVRNPPPHCSAKHCFYQDKKMKVTKKERLDIGRFECDGCQGFFHGICSGVFTSDDRDELHHPDNIHQCFSCRKWDLNKIRRDLVKKMDLTDVYVGNLENEYNSLNDEKTKLEDVYGGNGGYRKKLEQCWKENGADMSTYKQNFNGNQTYALLETKAIDEMFAIFPSTIQHEHLKAAAKNLGLLQSLCTSNIFDDDQHLAFETALNDFIEELKKAHPDDTITPKLHWLHKHVLPFVKLHHTWARACEQGIESMHAYANELMRHFASCRSKELQMYRVFKRMILNNRLSDKFRF
ncbi:unnamed protein product [Caenorhabditis angaria]|uniref:Zinc finger PHD-type domain-containing protein n=1 Tax=Caenorhabditis angaria TaxID=860376 RepID=A0A9P1MXK2_9PELO|nr:unnamed protein product [Caenorhabditis angaria]